MSGLEAEGWGLQQLIATWEGGLQGVAELGRRLTPEQWEAPTECPGWSVGDLVRHMAWGESFLLGRPEPEPPGDLDWTTRPHVRSDFARQTELGVEVRRSQSQQECCDELAGLVDVRLARIMGLDPLSADTPVPFLFGGEWPLGRVLRTRIYDTWTHEQDIRRAVALPANLASPGAQVTAVQLVGTLGYVLGRVLKAPPGSTLRVTITGPVSFERWAVVDADGRGGPCDPVEQSTVGLTTDWETYARLATGRLDVTDPAVLAACALEGDPDLAARLPAALNTGI